jgi:predicted Zn-dependent protease
MGEGVLGHAHLGKGVVEVSLGDYSCDGSFQLYDVESVQTIMTHEIGHSIGLPHTNDRANIMYPSYTPSYAYCLLDLSDVENDEIKKIKLPITLNN